MKKLGRHEVVPIEFWNEDVDNGIMEAGNALREIAETLKDRKVCDDMRLATSFLECAKNHCTVLGGERVQKLERAAIRIIDDVLDVYGNDGD